MNLSPEQQAVVAHRNGHLQVIACAGSGKTEAISRRVAGLIDEGIEPRGVIAFTFTERAAAALKARITQRVLEIKGREFLDRLGPMFVGTIHAFCLRLLQDNVPAYGNYDILDEHRLAGILSREHKRLGLGALGERHWRPIFDFLRNAEVVENELIEATALNDTPFGECYRIFSEMLARYHFLTYGQLISHAVRALGDPGVFARVHGHLRHLIVDEYQDINPAQERLIELLASPPVHLCVVGDDDQAIYQWRGSDVSNIIDFRSRYQAASKLLSVNRRSRPRILEMANRFAESICPRLPKAMQPWRPPAEMEIHAWSSDRPEDEAELIADTIQGLAARGCPYKDIGVLYRSVRTSAPPLVAALRRRGVPFRCAGRTGLFKQPEASALGRTYAWLSGNAWKNERFETSESVDLTGLVREYEEVFGKGGPELAAHFTNWKATVSDNEAPVNLLRDYYRLLHLLHVQDLDLDGPSVSARMGCLARFSQILADFEHVTRRARYVDEDEGPVFRAGQDRGVYFYRHLFNYLQYYALDAYEDFEGEDTFDLDAVNLLTVHQAKGLEWPVVFVPCLVEGRFPSRRAGEGQDWLLPAGVFGAAQRRRYEGGEAEERRLFYVALTRARDVLYLSRFRRKTRGFVPSHLLLAVAGEDPRPSEHVTLPPPFQPPAGDAEDPPTLSFSALAQYEGCPLRYRLSSSLGFQPQLVTELGYGKTIHHVLRRIADHTRASGRLPTAEDVEQIFREEFYLPFANRAAFEQLWQRARELVDRYLAEYNGDLRRVWETERPFALHLDRAVVSGRADVILDDEGGLRGALALVDYKTASERTQDDVFAFQLAVYAAAGRGEGIDVQAAYLHDLSRGIRYPVNVDDVATASARGRASDLVNGILDGRSPARPGRTKCRYCDVGAICRHAQCGTDDS